MQAPDTKKAVLFETAYHSFYFRDNLNGTNVLPPVAPFHLCPDIIQSVQPLKSPATTLGSEQSWSNMYNVQPEAGEDNYYYLRGINGAQLPTQASLQLYYTPAQLILLPSLWQSNQLSTADGDNEITVKAGAGQKAVATEAFVFPSSVTPETGSDFYSFVATTDDPLPTISSWLDMSEFFMGAMSAGFRNTCQVEADAASWQRNIVLTVPDYITTPGTMQLAITATGMSGNTVALTVNTIQGSGGPANIQPVSITNDSFNAVVNFTPGSGYSATLSLQYSNDSGSFPDPGATITLAAYYEVPASAVYEAGIRGTLNHFHSKLVSQTTGMPIQQYALLGAASFIAG